MKEVAFILSVALLIILCTPFGWVGMALFAKFFLGADI